MSNHLPVSRIKTIMQSSADVGIVSKESILLVKTASELFIQHLAKLAEKQAGGKQIEYKHLAEVVNSSARYKFITEIIPHKITVRQYKKMLLERDKNPSSTEDSDSDDSQDNNSGDRSNDRENSSSEDQNEEKLNGPL